ncbi:MAG: hypothetical protein GY930_01250 [bacterium]|nr:hypothetical protein [bacterium]
MEPGHPDLAGYEFFAAKLHLTKLWLMNDGSNVTAEAEFILAAPCKHQEESPELQQLLASRDAGRPELLSHQQLGRGYASEHVFYLMSLPRRGWNHGKDVDSMLEQVKAKRSASLAADLARWALDRVENDCFRIPANAQTYRGWPTYEFPLTQEFELNAEMVAVEWVAPHIGHMNRTDLYVLGFDFS